MRALAAAAVLLAGCGTAVPDDRPTLTVFAAASLTEALQEAAAQYDAASLELSFAGSPSLVAQVRQGAPADVVISADEASMRALSGEVADPVVVARNALAVVTERTNPRDLDEVADLALPGLAVVLAASDVPAGRAARTALAAAGVTVRPVSEEPDVKAVLAKVRLGEADAGVVYATDLAAAGDDVAGFALPGVVNAYPAAVASASDDAVPARRFVRWLRSGAGQALFERLGFLPP